MGHSAFRLLIIFLISCIMLLSVNPPFVQVRSKKKRNALEAAPCSYYRVMVVSVTMVVIVVILPVCIRNKNTFVATYEKLRQMVSRGK